MGLISGQINKRYTARLALPTQAVVGLNQSEVFDILQRLVEGYRPETSWLAAAQRRTHGYWLEEEADGTRTVICGEPGVGRHAGRGYVSWQWRASCYAVPYPNKPGRFLVQLRLSKGITRDKKFVRGEAYEELRDRFVAALQAADPTFFLVPPAT